MQKKILIAVDDSIYSKNSVKYAVGISDVVPDISYAIFNVQSTVSQFLVEEAKKDMKVQSELSKLLKRNETASHDLLGKYKDLMINMGIDAKKIEIATKPKSLVVAKDILDFGQKLPYDAIVAGRRGVSRLQKTFMGSVTSNILEHSTAIPFWLIDGTVDSSKKIMIAVDGSASSIRAIDHVCFMLEESKAADITLFNVIPKIKLMGSNDNDKDIKELDNILAESSKQNIEKVFSNAKILFEKAGLKEDQIHFKTSSRFLSPGKAIIDESEKGNYGTVIVGRSGVSKSIFIGSVSRYVINHISNRALWIVS